MQQKNNKKDMNIAQLSVCTEWYMVYRRQATKPIKLF